MAHGPQRRRVPVMSEAQFAALAMGAHPYKVCQLHWHSADYRPLLEKMGIDWRRRWAEFQEDLKQARVRRAAVPRPGTTWVSADRRTFGRTDKRGDRMSDTIVGHRRGPGGPRGGPQRGRPRWRASCWSRRRASSAARRSGRTTPLSRRTSSRPRRRWAADRRRDLREPSAPRCSSSTSVTACEGDAGDFRLTVKGPGGERDDRVRRRHRRHRLRALRSRAARRRSTATTSTPTCSPCRTSRPCSRTTTWSGPSTGLPPERICFVQCVGSRDRHIGNEYCSKVCCGVASKEAIEVRQLCPTARSSSSTSTCGCTATGRTRSTGPRRKSTTSSTSRASSPRSSEGRQAPRPRRGHHHGPADGGGHGHGDPLRRDGAVAGHPGDGRRPRRSSPTSTASSRRPMPRSTRSPPAARASSPAALSLGPADLEDCASSAGRRP